MQGKAALAVEAGQAMDRSPPPRPIPIQLNDEARRTSSPAIDAEDSRVGRHRLDIDPMAGPRVCLRIG